MSRIYDFIANTSDGVFGVDRQQRIVLWNDAARSMLGYRPDQVLGRSCYGIMRGRDARGCTVCQRDCDAILAAERFEFPASQNALVRTEQGDEIWIDLSMIVVPSETRELSVLIHLFREVGVEHEVYEVVREFARLVGVLTERSPEQVSPASPNQQALEKLTPREREILTHLMGGVPTESIAERLCISPRTVRNHVSNILAKLGVHSRLEAVAYSARKGLV